MMYCQGNPRAGVFIMTLQSLSVLDSQAPWLSFTDPWFIFSLNALDLTHSSSSGSQRAARGMLGDIGPCLRSSCRDAQDVPYPGTVALLPTPSAHCRVLLFGSNPPSHFPVRADLRAVLCSLPSPPVFLRVPATAVTTCSEMQVIRLMPASFAW